MKVKISESEHYPVYSVEKADNNDTGWRFFDVTEEEFRRWTDVIEEYNKVQDKMGELYERAESEFFSQKRG